MIVYGSQLDHTWQENSVPRQLQEDTMGEMYVYVLDKVSEAWYQYSYLSK